jgi:hypothetical protein
MKGLFLCAVVVVGLISAPAQPAPPPEAPWVLLGLDIHMGAVTMRDTAADADTVSVYGEGLPVYQTAAACQAALRHAIQKVRRPISCGRKLWPVRVCGLADLGDLGAVTSRRIRPSHWSLSAPRPVPSRPVRWMEPT